MFVRISWQRNDGAGAGPVTSASKQLPAERWAANPEVFNLPQGIIMNIWSFSQLDNSIEEGPGSVSFSADWWIQRRNSGRRSDGLAKGRAHRALKGQGSTGSQIGIQPRLSAAESWLRNQVKWTITSEMHYVVFLINNFSQEWQTYKSQQKMDFFFFF